MKKIENILIIGVGLIGASLARSIKAAHPDIFINGYSHDETEIVGAKDLGIIDDGGSCLKQGAEVADVIFFCTPVKVTLALMEEVNSFNLKSDVLLTDVGSTKQEILEQAQIFEKNNRVFIGGHPMAGSHKSGFLAADKDLFENAYYILVPINQNQQKEVVTLQFLLKGTHAKFIELTAKEHDEMTAVLSHMPHLLASQLVERAEELMILFPESRKLAAGGFRDITRIASSDPKMWTDISVSNSNILASEIDRWLVNLTELKKRIIDKNEQALFSFFKEAKNARDSIPVHKEGSIPGFHDIYVNVPDYPGAIAEVTAVLAEAKISLINIKIMETRDDIFGVLRISFKNERDATIAMDCLNKKTTYTSFIS